MISRNGEKVVLSASKQAIAQAALAPGPRAVVSADREGIISRLERDRRAHLRPQRRPSESSDAGLPS